VRLADAHGVAIPKLQLLFRVIQGVEAAEMTSALPKGGYPRMTT
jgi:hypothetical protein